MSATLRTYLSALTILAVVMMISNVYSVQVCSNLNAIAEVVSSKNYTQYLVDQQPVNEYFTVYASRDVNVDYNTMNISSSGGKVVLSLLQSDSNTYTVVNQNMGLFLTDLDSKVEDRNVTFVGVSNVIRTTFLKNVDKDYKYKNDIETAVAPKYMPLTDGPSIITINHTAIVTIVPTVLQVDGSLRFAILDANSTTLPLQSYNDTLGIFAYQFPTNIIPKEPYYNANGTILGYQDNTLPASAQINDLPSQADSSNLQKVINVRLLGATVEKPEQLGSNINLDFVVTLLNQGSLKLIRYNVATSTENNIETPISVKQTMASLIMPRVDADNLSLGAKVNIQGSNLYMLITISKDQRAAFEKFHGIKLDFDASQDVAPFLITIDLESGKMSTPINLSKKLVKTSKNYATDLDIRGDEIIIVGNTEDITAESTVDQIKNVQSFWVHISGDNLNSGYFGDNLFNEHDKTVFNPTSTASLRFVAYATSFSIDKVSGKFVVGGSVTDFSQPWILNGRLSLLQFNSTSGTSDLIYNLQMGYEGSNQVRIVRRATKDNANVKGGNDEVINAGMSMHGPTTAPPVNPIDDKFRNVAAGFWQVDCEPINYELAQVLTYVFYAVFAVITAIMAFIIVFFSSYGIYLCIKDRMGGDEETESLIR